MTYRFQEIYESVMQDILATGEIEADSARLQEIVSDALLVAVDEAADSILATIKTDTFADCIEVLREQRLEFEQRLASIWGEAFDLYELLVSLAEGIGSDFNNEFREDAVRSNDAVFEALTRLQGRACQVAQEVLVLLRSGYADGAHARWRTLHEISVVACLLSENGQELAEKYILHEKIQQYKLARESREYGEFLELEPISPEEFSALEKVRNDLVSKFGKSFNDDHGWGASVTYPERPTFRRLEQLVNLDHWRPYYRAASDNVHANVHGALYRIGLGKKQGHVILTGPSNAGLADPGHSAAISLYQVTTVLLNARPSVDGIVLTTVLQKLLDDVGIALLKGHELVESLSSHEEQLE